MTEREAFLRQELAELLDLPPERLSLTVGLTEQGVDSLVGLRLLRKIADVTGEEADLEWAFDHPTIQQLARFLDERYGPMERAAE